MGYNFKNLKKAILELSEATEWEVAKKEWALINIVESEEPETCLCGHYPIKEVCVIYNRITRRSVEVGNVCVTRFLGLRSDLIFRGIKRVREDLEKSLNPDCITFFFEKNLLTLWEYEFLQNTYRRRKLTMNQISTRIEINKKVLNAISRRGFQGP